MSRAIVLSILMLASAICQGQATIQDQFANFYENETNTWQEYRMMKMPKLKSFWAVVSDTLSQKDQKISAAHKEIQGLKNRLSTSEAKINELELTLSSSQKLNDSISFLGMNMSKTSYGIMVWGIIILLSVGIASVYLLYLRSNMVTRKVQKAYSSLESEYAEHRDRSRESQVKLKRELQTALNTLHENRINL